MNLCDLLNVIARFKGYQFGFEGYEEFHVAVNAYMHMDPWHWR